METLREQAERIASQSINVSNRESYVAAILRRLEREQASQPGAIAARAQSAVWERNDKRREQLPPAATEEQIAASKPYLEQMRQALASSKRTASK